VVKLLTHNPKIKGSNPTIGIRRKIMVKTITLAFTGGTLVAQWPNSSNNKGSNPATTIGRKKMVKNYIHLYC
jgi:hypothetical protein